MRAIFFIGGVLLLAACARTQAIRTSADTMVVQASAAPACGSQGSARVASESAAIETLRAGYDRYIIFNGNAQNNVMISQLPGTVHTIGTATYGGGFGTYNSTSYYTPGPMIALGSHDENLAIKMFRDGDSGADQALSARSMLGPDWAEKVKNGIHTCL